MYLVAIWTDRQRDRAGRRSARYRRACRRRQRE